MTLILNNSSTQVYYTLFTEIAGKLDLYQSFLSKDEIIRAKKFNFKTDQDHFILARGYLRELLATQLNSDPRSLPFQYGLHGKPSTDRIQFNLSHTKTACAIAITHQGNIGIDIEDITREVDIDNIAKRVLSKTEINYLNSVPTIEKQQTFYRCWTRKEAYVKALGIGIAAGDLRSLTITTDDQPISIVSNYQIIDLPSQDQHVITLAIETI
jgi:4'-phosphopantetheinyl transferase